MKIRQGFVSNSSSSSVIVSKNILSNNQINKIKDHIYYGKKDFQIDWATKNQRWNIEETEEEITMSTGKDNFNMNELLDKIGIHDDDIKYNGI